MTWFELTTICQDVYVCVYVYVHAICICTCTCICRYRCTCRCRCRRKCRCVCVCICTRTGVKYINTPHTPWPGILSRRRCIYGELFPKRAWQDPSLTSTSASLAKLLGLEALQKPACRPMNARLSSGPLQKVTLLAAIL